MGEVVGYVGTSVNRGHWVALITIFRDFSIFLASKFCFSRVHAIFNGSASVYTLLPTVGLLQRLSGTTPIFLKPSQGLA